MHGDFSFSNRKSVAQEGMNTRRSTSASARFAREKSARWRRINLTGEIFLSSIFNTPSDASENPEKEVKEEER
jgi:hypothetical protein